MGRLLSKTAPLLSIAAPYIPALYQRITVASASHWHSHNLTRWREMRNAGSVNVLAMLVSRQRSKYSSSARYSSINVKTILAPLKKRVGQ